MKTQFPVPREIFDREIFPAWSALNPFFWIMLIAQIASSDYSALPARRKGMQSGHFYPQHQHHPTYPTPQTLKSTSTPKYVKKSKFIWVDCKSDFQDNMQASHCQYQAITGAVCTWDPFRCLSFGDQHLRFWRYEGALSCHVLHGHTDLICNAEVPRCDKKPDSSSSIETRNCTLEFWWILNVPIMVPICPYIPDARFIS